MLYNIHGMYNSKNTCNIFYNPELKMFVHQVFDKSHCLSVALFNIGHKFWTINDIAYYI